MNVSIEIDSSSELDRVFGDEPPSVLVKVASTIVVDARLLIELPSRERNGFVIEPVDAVSLPNESYVYVFAKATVALLNDVTESTQPAS